MQSEFQNFNFSMKQKGDLVASQDEWQSLGNTDPLKLQRLSLRTKAKKSKGFIQLLLVFYQLFTQDRAPGYNDLISMMKPILMKIYHALQKKKREKPGFKCEV